MPQKPKPPQEKIEALKTAWAAFDETVRDYLMHGGDIEIDELAAVEDCTRMVKRIVKAGGR